MLKIIGTSKTPFNTIKISITNLFKLITELEREYYYSEYGEEYDEGDPDYYEEEYDEDSYNDRGIFTDISRINFGFYFMYS